MNLREVTVAKVTANVKQHELAPVRGGTMLDLDLEQAIYLNTLSGELDRPLPATAEKRDHTDIIIVPTLASWFDYKKINAIERRALPEFFNKTSLDSTKNPDIYLHLRNSIINTYRLNPREYLTVTACQRHISKDICDIMKIHALLEQWGIINYHMEPEPRQTLKTPTQTNHFHLLADTPTGVKLIEPVDRQTTQAAIQMFNTDVRDSDSDSPDEEEENRKALRFGLPLDDFRDHLSAFQNRGAATLSQAWTEDETLLLLEAVELYKDDWPKVCGHVGGRTQDECILHFLRLPIEDPFLVEEESYGPFNGHQPMPFSKSGNPIMSTIAFLGSVVNPKVAASAAKAALQELSRLAELDAPKDVPIDEKNLNAASVRALDAAAETSRHLAAIEERKIKQLVTVLVDTQLKKLYIKMKHYEELEYITEKEMETIQNQRKQLMWEQLM